MAKKIKYLFDGVHEGGAYVRCFKERRELVVQVWLSGSPEGTPDGTPDGDWEMPGALGAAAAIAQAVMQTAKKASGAGK